MKNAVLWFDISVKLTTKISFLKLIKYIPEFDKLSKILKQSLFENMSLVLFDRQKYVQFKRITDNKIQYKISNY